MFHARVTACALGPSRPLKRRRPGSLYSIVEYELEGLTAEALNTNKSPPPPLEALMPLTGSRRRQGQGSELLGLANFCFFASWK